MYAINTNGFCKPFKRIASVQNPNLHVPRSTIVGFIGENTSAVTSTALSVFECVGTSSVRSAICARLSTGILRKRDFAW